MERNVASAALYTVKQGRNTFRRAGKDTARCDIAGDQAGGRDVKSRIRGRRALRRDPDPAHAPLDEALHVENFGLRPLFDGVEPAAVTS